MNTKNDTRTWLLNIAAGGAGNTEAWIEPTPDGAAVLHIPARVSADGKVAAGTQVRAGMAACRGLLRALQTGAQPKAPAGEEDGSSREPQQQTP